MADIAKSTNQNILPVQALFNVDGTFNTFIGQGQPFYVMGTETISITDTSVNANLYPTFTTATSGGVTGLSVSSSAITFNPGTATLTTTNFAGSLTGTASSATNLAGGVSGQIPYQSASGTTSFVTNSISGYVLTSNGTSAPTWQPATGGLTISSVLGATTYYPSFATSVGPTSTAFIDTSNLSYTSGVLTGVYQGTWQGSAIGAIYGGTGFSTYATGDLIYASATNTLSKLTAGTNGYVLTLSGGVPTWASSTGGVTSFSGGTTGLTPNTATTGAIVLSGTLAVANGGTGVVASSGANSVVLRDANQNFAVNAVDDNYTNTVASGTTITLTVASARRYTITGLGGQVIKLPDATTLTNGAVFAFDNNQSSGAITVNNNSNTLVVSVPSGGFVLVNLLSNATSAGSWDRHDQAPSNVSWSTNTLNYPGTITGTTWNGTAIGAIYGGTAQTTYATGDILYASATNTLSKLSVGTNGYVLTLAGGVPTWASSATATYTRTSFTATVGQTTFSVTYTAPYIAVYQNGTLLNASDYTASNGTTVVLTVGASTGDIIETIAYNLVAIGSAAGSNTQVQYNNSGVLGANANFTYTGNDLNIPFGTSNSATSSAKIALALSMIA